MEKMKFSRQCISHEIVHEMFEFLNRDDISRASSCRSVMVDGKETPVRYWKDSVKNTIQQYLLEYPNGVKRTYIYTHLPRNFRMNTMLAGLCNLCDDFGYSNFENLYVLVKETSDASSGMDLPAMQKKLEAHQQFLRTRFSKQVSWYFCFSIHTCKQ